MFTSILAFLSSAFEPVTKLVDKVSTTDQERLELRNQLASIQSELYTKMIELEGKRMEMEAEVKKAEAASQYWIVATWRPVVSIGLVGCIVVAAFTNKQLPAEITTLAELFLGVHAGGRTIEKIAKNIKLGK